MTERSFNDAYWGDPEVQPLSTKAKLLRIYLANNRYCNQAGLYEITPRSIEFDTGLTPKDIDAALAEIGDKVVYDKQTNLLWEKGFLRRNAKSPKFLIAVLKCLERVKDGDLVKGYLSHNTETFKQFGYPIDTLSIPYQGGENGLVINHEQKKRTTRYPIDTLSIGYRYPLISSSSSISSSIPNKGGLGGNENNCFSVFENEIGLLSPSIAERLTSMLEEYPDEWICDALREAALQNKRRLPYVEGICKRWKAEGRAVTGSDNGRHRCVGCGLVFETADALGRHSVRCKK